ncbi:MAG: glucokinase [Pseudomonadota bacterium]|nr:glucokinase [Pseudomonadota bacterium]
MILVGDVGGTRTRLALATRRNGGWQLEELREEPTGPDILTMIREYLGSVAGPGIDTAAFCGAGPVADDGSIRLTNAPVLLEPAALARAAGAGRALLINDFAAVAESLPALTPAQLRICGGGGSGIGPRVVMGPGTGFGVAIATPSGDGWAVVAGDGGHADLAPVDDEELEVWRRLRAQHGRVSAETVLCGPGLERLHLALHGPPHLGAEQIALCAWRGEATAVRTVALFTRWLGSVAGNLALIAGALGGVYLAGGILPRWGDHFDTALFRTAFEDKPPYAGWLAGLPAYVVTHPAPALLGLALRAGSYTAAE